LVLVIVWDTPTFGMPNVGVSQTITSTKTI